MGKSALSSSSPRAEKQGRAAHAGGGPGPVAWGLEGGRSHGEKRGGAMGG